MATALDPWKRFWMKVNINGPVPAERPELGPCWIWTSGCWESGYGKFRTGGRGSKMAMAHRYCYEKLRGPIPMGCDLDHLCKRYVCVNPRHLEAVSSRENTMRADGPTAINARKTQCPQGHPYDEANTYYSGDGKRYCRQCMKDSKKRSRDRARGHL